MYMQIRIGAMIGTYDSLRTPADDTLLLHHCCPSHHHTQSPILHSNTPPPSHLSHFHQLVLLLPLYRALYSVSIIKVRALET